MQETTQRQLTTEFPAIHRRRLTTLQMNLGYLCNIACVHCHVSAGPKRTELMSRETIDTALEVIDRHGIGTVDLTGGSPEMNPHFRDLVRACRGRGVHVMDRLNPTIMNEPGYEWVGPFLAEQRVEAVASLPCYTEDRVDAQRGKGVFGRSIDALQALNRLGYGQPGSGLVLNLVYNPGGPSLPPDQASLEADYKRHLRDEYGIEFNNLFVIANMPIERFAHALRRDGQLDGYMDLLKSAYRPENLEQVMCKDLVSIDWQGYLYDCDFNQMLNLPLGAGAKPRTHLRELLNRDVDGAPIAIADHCFGCTAGQGSSCGGALS
ncbi:arsenosugar biosynthesis radical SAM protein ArsS [Ectothiorhodospiraceae bacterium WFHF3C12]|nr:arsenosugar biosynthesis radical SAM protein ArsS [Ectothiorhodospiraceae bacterium WFHF3C12]